MARDERTSAIVDGLLHFLITGGILTVGLTAPNAIQALDKPLRLYFKKMDERSRKREYRRYVAYMKKQGLVKFKADDYEHGIVLTKAGKKRAEKSRIDNLTITKPQIWDQKWRIVFFDIPQSKKYARDTFTRKLKRLGFIPLQQSTWVYPYGCRGEIEDIAYHYNLKTYITYIETSFINNGDKLKARFKFSF
jgi:hypothetical protein